MNSSERALCAMRVQVSFDLVQAGADVAAAAAHTVDMQKRLNEATNRAEAIVDELRGAMRRSSLNPALVAALRGLYRMEQQLMFHQRGGLIAAEQREQQARAALAGVRDRDRSLERALKAERRKQRLKRQALEWGLIDDLWLQQARRDG